MLSFKISQIEWMFQWLTSKCSNNSSVASTVSIILVSLLLWKVFLRIRKEYRISKVFNKIPGVATFTVMGYLLGNIEIYYKYMWNLKREKGMSVLKFV